MAINISIKIKKQKSLKISPFLLYIYMSSILDIERGVTQKWLKENGWLKTPSFTRDRNPWWTKKFNGMTSNGGTRDIVFAFDDESMVINCVKGFPYPEMDVEDISDIEIFIKTQLKDYTEVQYLGRTYLMEKTVYI